MSDYEARPPHSRLLKAMPEINRLMAEHKDGGHRDRKRPGCASCVFGKREQR